MTPLIKSITLEANGCDEVCVWPCVEEGVGFSDLDEAFVNQDIRGLARSPSCKKFNSGRSRSIGAGNEVGFAKIYNSVAMSYEESRHCKKWNTLW